MAVRLSKVYCLDTCQDDILGAPGAGVQTRGASGLLRR